jgi:hypothetical protein
MSRDAVRDSPYLHNSATAAASQRLWLVNSAFAGSEGFERGCGPASLPSPIIQDYFDSISLQAFLLPISQLLQLSTRFLPNFPEALRLLMIFREAALQD